MEIAKRTAENRLRATIAAASDSSYVYVAKQYTPLLKSIPRDGRIYVVEDPRSAHVCHLTYPDGRYVRMDSQSSTKQPGQPHSVKVEIRTKSPNGKPKKHAHRLAERFTVGVKIQRQSEDSPSICLIDIHRVMRICGFKKSFIYEQFDFPKPVRLGASQRSSVRWVESEVVNWVAALTSQRIGLSAAPRNVSPATTV